MAKIAFLDAFAGAAGDMWVGALLDQGLDLDALRPAVQRLGLPGVSLRAEKVTRAGLAGTHFVVEAPPEHHHRHLPDIRAILARAELPSPVLERATAAFEVLAEAEAKVHDQPVEQVHFHEVGAVDTIVDVVCAVLGMHILGIERVYCSAVTVGRGTVRCAHGEMPVPAPGAMGSMLGMPLRAGGPAHECVTPTGAALLKVLVDEFEPGGELRWVPTSVGYGAGTRDPEGHPNLLRISLGQSGDPGAASQLVELACQLDNVTGEQVAYLMSGALDRQAVDVYTVPVLMKKGRPGHLLVVFCERGEEDELSRFLLQESGTLGLRHRQVERTVLQRQARQIQTDLGPVLCKAVQLPSGLCVLKPEEEEVLRLIREHGIDRTTLLHEHLARYLLRNSPAD